MNQVSEPSRLTPVADDVDLCVVGGGCTGVFAAVAAARLGASVALIENHGFFGGVATAGLVNIWHTLLDTAFERPIIAGLTVEVIERLKRRQAVWETEPSADRNFVLNTPELALELDRLVREANVRPFLHARFVAAAMEGQRVSAAIIEDKTGRRAIRARYFIDATGDGDLIARAGLPFTQRGDLQPPTTCFLLHGLDGIQKANPGFSLYHELFNPRHQKDIPVGFLWSAPVTGLPGAEMIAGTRVPGADCSDADQLTAAEIEGRRQVGAFLDILRAYPGGEGVALLALPACIGIRETRHASCLHTLTEEEVLTGRRFDDAIANGTYRVDVHHSDRPGLTFRFLDGTEIYAVPGRPREKGRWRPPLATGEDPRFYQIPYRCLVQRGTSNVLVAGRLIDADRGAYGAIRVMVNCNQTGEAAGTAAALAMHHDLSVADVPAEELRETMKRQGAIML